MTFGYKITRSFYWFLKNQFCAFVILQISNCAYYKRNDFRQPALNPKISGKRPQSDSIKYYLKAAAGTEYFLADR
jgi:hypothetical protein